MKAKLLLDGPSFCIPHYCSLVQASSQEVIALLVPLQRENGACMPHQRLPTHACRQRGSSSSLSEKVYKVRCFETSILRQQTRGSGGAASQPS